jgi:glycosyltransferase involved in cell wall biosynthesis
MRINLQAPINQLGYGVAGLNIFKALQDKAEVSLFPIGQPQLTSQSDADAVTRGVKTAQSFDPNAPCIKIWHQNQMAERIGSGKFIGFPIFELDTFNDLEKHHLQSCDELMVCSQWARKVVTGSNFGYYRADGRPKLPPKTHVVPLGVDAELFPPAPARQNDKTIFFNCGKWEIRKGHDILIKAFKKVLEHGEDAELWMMCSNPFNNEQENAQWHQLYNHPKVKLIPRADTQQEVYNMMSQVDCGVFPSRGEGWNLELLEMMAAGKHVIATDYSAHTEFCTKFNCGLVTIKEVEPAYDGKWFFGQGNWAKIDAHAEMDLYMKMMRFILDKKGTRNREGTITARKFSWDNTANKIMEALK